MKHLRITVEGKTYDVTVERFDAPDDAAPPLAPAAIHPVSSAAPAARPTAAPKTATAPGDVLSPLAGIVKAVDTQIGAAVKAGDSLMTLEAMKMYTAISAPTDGTVTAIHVSPGDAVDEGQPLYTLA
ncbi:MAG: biotin/lipoyl-binding protein [Verrucomicrobia bacterium]|nr:MAG: biotin/lipoyl-binding protein [Verrucomicrobiota bacterium]